MKRFQNEAKIIAKFNHPNIVPVFSCGEEKGAYYISMALVPGLSLDQVIASLRETSPSRISSSMIRDILHAHEQVPRLAPQSGDSKASIMAKKDQAFWNLPYHKFVCRIAAELLDALSYAHNNNIYHGDLKPSNIMLTTDGIPMIVDFGLARDVKTLITTQSKDFLGTVAYASPEQIQSNKVNDQTDIWSMGVTIYELLSLKHPFYEESVAKSISNIINTDPPSIRKVEKSIPRELDTIIQKCMEKTPQRRYLSAERLKEDFTNFLDSKPISAKPVGILGRTWKWIKRNRIVSALLLCLLIAGVTSFSLYVRNKIENLVNEGSVYYDHGSYDQSLEKYHEAIGWLDFIPFPLEQRKVVLCKLGDSYLGKGEYERAEGYFEKTLDIDPSYASAISGTADIHYELGHYDKCIELYKKVLLISPSDRDSYFQLGKAYSYKNSHLEAILAFHSGIQIAPQDNETIREIRSELNKLYFSSNKRKKIYLQKNHFSDQEIKNILDERLFESKNLTH